MLLLRNLLMDERTGLSIDVQIGSSQRPRIASVPRHRSQVAVERVLVDHPWRSDRSDRLHRRHKWSGIGSEPADRWSGRAGSWLRSRRTDGCHGSKWGVARNHRVVHQNGPAWIEHGEVVVCKRRKLSLLFFLVFFHTWMKLCTWRWILVSAVVVQICVDLLWHWTACASNLLLVLRRSSDVGPIRGWESCRRRGLVVGALHRWCVRRIVVWIRRLWWGSKAVNLLNGSRRYFRSLNNTRWRTRRVNEWSRQLNGGLENTRVENSEFQLAWKCTRVRYMESWQRNNERRLAIDVTSCNCSRIIWRQFEGSKRQRGWK